MKPAPGTRTIPSPRTMIRIVSLTMILVAAIVTIQVMSVIMDLLDLNSLDQIWYLSWLS